jgi:hypothetical protein
MTEHVFKLAPGEIVKINGVPYEHTYDGYLRGTIDPTHARGLIDMTETTARQDIRRFLKGRTSAFA